MTLLKAPLLFLTQSCTILSCWIKNNRIWVWNNVKPSKYWCNFWLNYPLKPPYGVKWAFVWVVAVNGIPSLLNEDSAVCLWSPHMFPWLPRGSADLDLRVYAVIPFLCIFVLPFMRYTSINYIEASFQYMYTMFQIDLANWNFHVLQFQFGVADLFPSSECNYVHHQWGRGEQGLSVEVMNRSRTHHGESGND